MRAKDSGQNGSKCSRISRCYCFINWAGIDITGKYKNFFFSGHTDPRLVTILTELSWFLSQK
jgi:hypothetical protein